MAVCPLILIFLHISSQKWLVFANHFGLLNFLPQLANFFTRIYPSYPWHFPTLSMFPSWFENFVNICWPKNILINKRFSTTLVHIFHISHNIWAIFTLTINNQGWRFRRQTQQFFWSRFAFQPLNNTLARCHQIFKSSKQFELTPLCLL